MIDIKQIRENPERFEKAAKDKGFDVDIRQFCQLEQTLRDAKTKLQDIATEKNKIGKSIPKLSGDEKQSALAQLAKLKQDETAYEDKAAQLQPKINELMLLVPQPADDDVPAGKDDTENVEIKRVGTPKTFDFELRNHGQLAADQGWADFERATKTSGAGFYFLKGSLVLLDMALQRFAIDLLATKGYIPIIPPYMINRSSYEGVTDLDDFEKVMYKIDGSDAYLIATSEHPIGAMYQDEIFEEKDLPLRFAGISPCFRREIGAHGLDTKGLFRVHQFTKVEQFVFCTPEDSWKIHEELLTNAEELFTKLGLCYHVVNICTGDIGTVAAKKYDIEVWMPRENAYKEVVSCSNCTSYQAVRLNIKVRDKSDFERKQHLHTLNSTAIATSRVMRAILENYQEPDGRVQVPPVLRSYMNDREYL